MKNYSWIVQGKAKREGGKENLPTSEIMDFPSLCAILNFLQFTRLHNDDLLFHFNCNCKDNIFRRECNARFLIATISPTILLPSGNLKITADSKECIGDSQRSEKYVFQKLNIYMYFKWSDMERNILLNYKQF